MHYQPMLSGNSPYVSEIHPLSQIGNHWHNEIEIIYCISGSFKIKIEGESHIVSANECVYVSSAASHEYYDYVPNTQIFLFEVGPLFLGDEFNKISRIYATDPVFSKTKNGIFSPSGSNALYLQMLELKNRCLDKKHSYSLIIKSALYRIAAILTDEYYMNHYNNIQYDRARSERLQSILKVQKAISYVYTNYNKDITNEEISRICGYTPTNFCMQFKSATGITFHKYLCNFRISKAKNLLLNNEMTINEIATEVGIPQAKTFCRIFKNLTGITPTEYKNSISNIEIM